MTSTPDSAKLKRLKTIAQFAFAGAIAFAVTHYALRLRGDGPAGSSAAIAPDAPDWTPAEGLPVPPQTEELFPLARQGGLGWRFQACYESKLPQARVRSFYEQALAAKGWQPLPARSRAMSKALQPTLSYARGRNRLLIVFWPSAQGGSEWNVNLVTQAAPRGASPTRTE